MSHISIKNGGQDNIFDLLFLGIGGRMVKHRKGQNSRGIGTPLLSENINAHVDEVGQVA